MEHESLREIPSWRYPSSCQDESDHDDMRVTHDLYQSIFFDKLLHVIQAIINRGTWRDVLHLLATVLTVLRVAFPRVSL